MLREKDQRANDAEIENRKLRARLDKIGAALEGSTQESERLLQTLEKERAAHSTSSAEANSNQQHLQNLLQEEKDLRRQDLASLGKQSSLEKNKLQIERDAYNRLLANAHADIKKLQEQLNQRTEDSNTRG